VEILKCDRCERIIKESQIGDDHDGESGDENPRFLITGSLVKNKVSFHDLCDSCKKRIDTLTEEIERGRRSGRPAKNGKTATKSTKATKNAKAATA